MQMPTASLGRIDSAPHTGAVPAMWGVGRGWGGHRRGSYVGEECGEYVGKG